MCNYSACSRRNVEATLININMMHIANWRTHENGNKSHHGERAGTQRRSQVASSTAEHTAGEVETLPPPSQTHTLVSHCCPAITVGVTMVRRGVEESDKKRKD